MKSFIMADGVYAFMCRECSQEFSTYDEFDNHVCTDIKDLFHEPSTSHDLLDADHDIIYQPSTSMGLEPLTEGYIPAEVVELNPNYGPEGLQGGTVVLAAKDNIEYLIRDCGGPSNARSYYEKPHITEPPTEESSNEGEPRRKRKNNNSSYLMNKLTRDPYFKLDNNSYTFKDTLGDWDERGTKLLIAYVGKYPKSHFLLQYYYERRLTHWESIQAGMHSLGYNFTVLQLRMRWREVLGKYRWTLNHNDLHPADTKVFEYMTEMDDLFGVWERPHTDALISLVEISYADTPSAKQKRLGQSGWERISSELTAQGYQFGTMQVEARWRMLTTSYKSMIDHNDMPTVEPIQAAFSDRLSKLVIYEPRRRKDYEKYKGKKIKLEKFPERGMNMLIKIYLNNAPDFLDTAKKNADVWNNIKLTLDSCGYNFSLKKIKEIFFATLKLHERSVQHNTIPGAIKREGPHFNQLTQIQEIYGSWPHIRRKVKTTKEKSFKRYSIKLRESMQIWKSEESQALLELYPSLLETQASLASTGQQVNDLWVSLAHQYEELGFTKRDIPSIAIHIGLLRHGYNQANQFPFVPQMKRIHEVEEALCYSPDISKFTGDAEILYWSHNAIFLMLDLYLEIQPLLPFSSFSNAVYDKVAKEMQKHGYRFSGIDVSTEFKALLFQYTLRRHKIEKASEDTWGTHKNVSFYRDKLHSVMRLREKHAVVFTNGVKPIPEEVASVAFYVARQRASNLFKGPLSVDQQQWRMKLIVLAIRREVKKLIGKKPPVARKICVLLSTSLANVAEGQEEIEDNDLIGLFEILKSYEYQSVLSHIMKDTHNGSYQIPRHILELEKMCRELEPSDQEEPTSDNIFMVKNEDTDDSEPEWNFIQPSTKDAFDQYEHCSISIKEENDASDEDSSPLPTISIDEALCNYSEREGGRSIIFVDQGISTKTTVHPPTDQTNVTCIKIENMI